VLSASAGRGLTVCAGCAAQDEDDGMLALKERIAQQKAKASQEQAELQWCVRARATRS